MARKVTEERKAAELKNKVRAVKKSLEVQQTFQQFQAVEGARAIAAKEAVESKGREAAVETSREGGCREREAKARQQTKQKVGAKTTAEADNVSRRTDIFRNDGCRQHAD